MRNNSWIALTLGMIVVFSSLCFAAIPSSSIGLGGITTRNFIKIEKDKFESKNLNQSKFYFSNGVVVKFDTQNPEFIEEIETKNSDSNVSTGVAVGMKESALNEHYGAADITEQTRDGFVEYKYLSVDEKKKMIFKVSKGVIQEIKCENQ